MNKKIITLIPLLSLLLAGCDLFRFPSKNSGSNSNSTSGSTTDVSSTDSSLGESATIDIYATNDFHGAVMEEYNNMGLSKWATYLKEKGEQNNTLLLDQGDTWQGSIYSNYNHGKLITDVMNYIHYDARSVGNHDFDWGIQYIEENTARSYEGYKTPVLAGNVYDFNFTTKEVGSTQQSSLGVKSVTYTLENGLKVGILGGIGRDQIESISSNFTMNIAFTDHIEFIKSEASHLRNDEHCDVVIASIHTGQESVMYNGLENYVDLVLCGHTHRDENANEGRLYYTQGEAYGQTLKHVKLTYSYQEHDVVRTEIESISANSVKNQITTIDSTVSELVTSYASECQTDADVVVASNVTGSFYSSGALPNLMCKAIYDECVAQGYNDILLSYVNKARVSKYSGTWTYADLYEAFPFDNEIYIAEITGEEYLNEVSRYNFIYRSSSFSDDTVINPNSTYKIALLDYLYFHTNTERYFDYFPTTGGTSTIKLSKNYREILRDWLISKGYASGTSLNSSDYSSSLWQHSLQQLPR